MAEALEVDLVEISPNADPPVCKIMDYGKFLYEQKKRDKMLKAKSTQIVVKEIRFGPQTDEHDYEFKRKNAEKFLKEGAKLKAFVASQPPDSILMKRERDEKNVIYLEGFRFEFRDGKLVQVQ
jgi:translation initiation factor IF-3